MPARSFRDLIRAVKAETLNYVRGNDFVSPLSRDFSPRCSRSYAGFPVAEPKAKCLPSLFFSALCIPE